MAKYSVFSAVGGRKFLVRLIIKLDCASLVHICLQWWLKDRCSSKYSPSSLYVLS